MGHDGGVLKVANAAEGPPMTDPISLPAAACGTLDGLADLFA